MCLYPKLIKNKKYLPNKNNNGTPPELKDPRTKYVPIGCGKCFECLKQKSRNWQVRLHEELRSSDMENNSLFVTLSFSDKSLIELEKYIINNDIKTKKKLAKKLKKQFNEKKYTPISGYYLDNKIAKTAIRLFLERWRSQYKKSVKHWFVTELGQNNTERLHLHGFLWTNKNLKTIEKIWKYGNVFIGDFVNEISINYMIKYVNKIDPKHKYYTPIILTSPGIGKGYLDRHDSTLNKFKNDKTNEMYKTRGGTKLPLPIYYRNKLYTDEQKEQLWLNLLDKNTRYVNGIKTDVSESEEDYNGLLIRNQRLNKQLGYGDDKENFNEKKYENDRRNLKRLQRINKLKK